MGFSWEHVKHSILKDPDFSRSEYNSEADKLLDMDGDWFYPEFYPKLVNALTKKGGGGGKTSNIIEAEKARGKLFKAWETMGNETLHPGKYYAVLAADGDGMGKALGSVESAESHRKTVSLYRQSLTPHRTGQVEIIYFTHAENVGNGLNRRVFSGLF